MSDSKRPVPDFIARSACQTALPHNLDAEIDAFHRYWRSLPAPGCAPYRSAVDPRAIEPLLEFAFIAERIAPGLTRLRVAGSHLNDLLGMDVRGMPLSSFIEANDREALSLATASLFEAPATLELDLLSRGRPDLQGRMLLLPLCSDLGDISRALGCLVTAKRFRHTPRRFKILNCKITNIDAAGSREIYPGCLPSSQYGHLRVVK